MSDVPHDDPTPPASRGRREAEGEGQKRCTKCGETKPFDAFHKDKSKNHGLGSRCKACNAVHNAAYNAAHRQEIAAWNATYYADHRDEILARAAAHYAVHREEILNRRVLYHVAYRAANRNATRAHAAIYRAANRAAIRARNAAHYAAHRDQYRARHAAHYAAHPDVYRAANQRRIARIKGNGGAGVSGAELRALRAAQDGFCAYCRFHYTDPLTIDHVIPIAQGGPHEIANIVLACRDCNSSKGARTPKQWTNRWYYDLDIARLM